MTYYEEKALRRADKYGIYSYEVKGRYMQYISYFGSEGFIRVVHDLETEEETRTHLAYVWYRGGYGMVGRKPNTKWFREHRYNYFTG